eukprot:TRINITY_DN1285_c0_g1_i1.p1 TRINITY_DN1285_c0_g1~~TRINITY_DN1285_c0_g1_i1.p1  ORF type:complete len:209 (-),score=37.31 TRINITY_DN1285_c0_g1_i1:117-743(-)
MFESISSYIDRWRKANIGGEVRSYTVDDSTKFKKEMKEVINEEKRLDDLLFHHEEVLATLNARRAKLNVHCLHLKKLVSEIRARENATEEQIKNCDRIQTQLDTELSPIIQNLDREIRTQQTKVRFIAMKQYELKNKGKEAKMTLKELEVFNKDMMIQLQEIVTVSENTEQPLIEDAPLLKTNTISTSVPGPSHIITTTPHFVSQNVC